MNGQGLASIPKKGNFSSILYPAHANRIWPVRSRDGWVGAWGEGRSGGNGVVYSAAKMGRNSQRLRYDRWLASKVRDGAENFVPIRKCFAQLRSDVFLSNLSSLPHPSRSNADLLDDTSRCCPCSPLLSRGEVFVRAVKRLALPFPLIALCSNTLYLDPSPPNSAQPHSCLPCLRTLPRP